MEKAVKEKKVKLKVKREFYDKPDADAQKATAEK